MGAPYKKSISRKSPECLLSFFNLNGVYTANIYRELRGLCGEMGVQGFHFMTISGHFIANYIDIFHKTEVLTVILRCIKCLNPNWIKS